VVYRYHPVDAEKPACRSRASHGQTMTYIATRKLAKLSERLLVSKGSCLELVCFVRACVCAQFPESVSHIIASFPELYGTADGKLLRRWASGYGWPIIWALGPNGTYSRPQPSFAQPWPCMGLLRTVCTYTR